VAREWMKSIIKRNANMITVAVSDSSVGAYLTLKLERSTAKNNDGIVDIRLADLLITVEKNFYKAWGDGK
jgi:hypothetical protein